ncbi:MAG: deoxyribodipyrimidine photo-lyase [Granulosicoccus sp.]|jgi:deoxyribodipyrimidine photo-lyase
MNKHFKRGLWWVKRDFRIKDNAALRDALAQCETVTALFVIEPELCASEETSFLHFHAWQQAADYLSTQLAAIGGRLIIRIGRPEGVFENLRVEQQMDALFSHQETGSAVTFARDLRVKHWAKENNLPWFESHQNGVVRALQDRDQRQPIIRQRLFETSVMSAPSSIEWWPDMPVSNSWPMFESVSGKAVDKRIEVPELQIVTEAAAQNTLNTFLSDRGLRYSGGISSPNTAFTAGSRLSIHLAWGTISLRQVFHALQDRSRELHSQSGAQDLQWRKSLKAFQARLHWHDHFMQRLESAPNMETEAINPAYRDIRYGDNAQILQAWCDGYTGLPLIDACVRCLAATGFLNFRMRAMLVTTGCFGLAQSWQALQYPLARLFLDYEPGIHFSQVQMQAGVVGINTLRVYSPHKQLLDHDSNAQFIKRWIPELRTFDAEAIANYESRDLGDYPSPIVDINATGKEIKDQIYAVRQSEAGRKDAATVLELHGSRKRTTRRRAPKAKKPEKPNPQLSLDFD